MTYNDDIRDISHIANAKSMTMRRKKNYDIIIEGNTRNISFFYFSI